MEIYTLNEAFEREWIIDRFESLIWSERKTKYGDFNLTVESNLANKNLLVVDTKLAMNRSNRVMIIENVEDNEESDGRRLLKVSGRSLETIFMDRVVLDPAATAWAEEQKWVLENTVGWVIRHLFQEMCVNNTRNPSDNITNYDTGNFYAPDTIPEPDAIFHFEIPPGDLYSMIEQMCLDYGLGFRLVRHPVSSKLYFNVYTGNDRTSTQSINNPVIFSPSLENLLNSSYYRSVESQKNVAYVYNKKNHIEIVYGQNIDPLVAGFSRKVAYVDATDIDLELSDPKYLDVVRQRGLEELARTRPVALLDGEVPEYNKYIYDLDYTLGDIVEMRNSDGITNRMEVVENIFVDDSDGERSYPTLALNELVMEGTWNDWRFNRNWDAMTTETWDTV